MGVICSMDWKGYALALDKYAKWLESERRFRDTERVYGTSGALSIVGARKREVERPVRAAFLSISLADEQRYTITDAGRALIAGTD